MKKWEYDSDVYGFNPFGQSLSLHELMSNRGNVGWELVSVITSNIGSITLFWKREKVHDEN